MNVLPLFCPDRMTCASIVIPTHNRDDLLRRAVHSALLACPSDGEVLVVDDRSLVPAALVLSSETDPRLCVIVNTGENGASNARNLGVASASGKVVFFLDDDDEIMADYCARVLRPKGPASQAGWGFASILEHHQDQASDRWRRRKRLNQGMIPVGAPTRDKVAAMSDGFWIAKSRFLGLGGLDPSQAIDEDTDFCVRLLADGHQPWYEIEPAMRVYRGYVPARPEGAQLTKTTPDHKSLECYRRTHDKNVGRFGSFSAERWFLATRYLRRAAKIGLGSQAKVFVSSQKPKLFGRALGAYLYLKIFKHF